MELVCICTWLLEQIESYTICKWLLWSLHERTLCISLNVAIKSNIKTRLRCMRFYHDTCKKYTYNEGFRRTSNSLKVFNMFTLFLHGTLREKLHKHFAWILSVSGTYSRCKSRRSITNLVSVSGRRMVGLSKRVRLFMWTCPNDVGLRTSFPHYADVVVLTQFNPPMNPSRDTFVTQPTQHM